MSHRLRDEAINNSPSIVASMSLMLKIEAEDWFNFAEILNNIERDVVSHNEVVFVKIDFEKTP